MANYDGWWMIGECFVTGWWMVDEHLLSRLSSFSSRFWSILVGRVQDRPGNQRLKLPSFRFPAAYGDQGLILAGSTKSTLQIGVLLSMCFNMFQYYSIQYYSILSKRAAIVLLSHACNACTLMFRDSLLTCWNRGHDSHILIETLAELRGNQWDFLTVHASLAESGSHTFQRKAMFGCGTRVETHWKSRPEVHSPSDILSFHMLHIMLHLIELYHYVQFCVAFWVFATEI